VWIPSVKPYALEIDVTISAFASKGGVALCRSSIAFPASKPTQLPLLYSFAFWAEVPHKTNAINANSSMHLMFNKLLIITFYWWQLSCLTTDALAKACDLLALNTGWFRILFKLFYAGLTAQHENLSSVVSRPYLWDAERSPNFRDHLYFYHGSGMNFLQMRACFSYRLYCLARLKVPLWV